MYVYIFLISYVLLFSLLASGKYKKKKAKFREMFADKTAAWGGPWCNARESDVEKMRESREITWTFFKESAC
jgi:hypothetical protein